MEPPLVYVDFGNADSVGRIRLITEGTRDDVEKQKLQFHDGMKIRVYDAELVTDATVAYSSDEHIWVAKIDWQKIKPGFRNE